MALETGTFISDLVPTNPVGSDPLAFADDHLRLVKSTIKNTFPNISGAVTKTHTHINNIPDNTTASLTALDVALKAYTDAAVAAVRQALYPVGSIYVNSGVTTNPATLLGFGTWVAFGAGRVMVGLNGSDTLFDVLEETGGSKDAVVVGHTHTFSGTTSGVGDHQHNSPTGVEFPAYGTTGIVANGPNGLRTDQLTLTGPAGAHDHTYSGTTSSTGSSGTNANIQPYITVAMWKRTA